MSKAIALANQKVASKKNDHKVNLRFVLETQVIKTLLIDAGTQENLTDLLYCSDT